MRPRFVGRLGLADAVTIVNAGIGFVAVGVAGVSITLAARLVLLAAIADAIDGIVARYRGGSELGEFLDSLADVASFGVAPALIVLHASTGLGSGGWTVEGYLGLAFGAAFLGMAVVRLAIYTADDTDDASTQGVQTTLAATLLAVGVLAGVPSTLLYWAVPAFAVLMVLPITYPDLRVRDAFLMGALQTVAIAVPSAFGSLFPRVLLAWALGYLVLGPVAYPGPEGKRS